MQALEEVKEELAAQSSRFAELRKALGLSATELAEKMNLTEQYLYGIVARKKGIPKSILILLARLETEKGKINVSWLLTGEGQMFINEDDKQQKEPIATQFELAFMGLFNVIDGFDDTINGLCSEVSTLRRRIEELEKR